MGTRTATGEVQLKMLATIKNVLDDGTTATSSVGGQIFRTTLENGVSSGQINRSWQKKSISITDGGFKDYNISTCGGQDIGAGAGNDAVGQAMDIEEIVLLVVVNRSGPGILEVQTPAPAAAKIVWIPTNFAANASGAGIRTGGMRMWWEPGTIGLDVSGGSSAVLRLSAASGQGAITNAEIYVLGRNDDDESSSSSSASSSSS